MPQKNHYNVEYRMELETGQTLSYVVEIDKNTLISQCKTPEEALPAWTRLEQEKCSQCKLPQGEHCPIAVRLVEPIRQFGGLLSHTPCATTVVAEERSYVKKVDVQDALRSLFGLIMATSGCPSMQPFRYMARYHLPFSSIEETVSRITCTYLMSQLFRHHGAVSMPIDLKEIELLYNTIQSLNESMARRLKKVAEGDGSINAIVILNSYSSLIPILIKEELLKLKQLFQN